MHHIHTTDGLVIQSRNHGEANKIVHIFTRDLGLIVAVAQGIRFEKSKLRYNIRDYFFSSFSLVHGKEFWRIVGAEELFEVSGEGGLKGSKVAILNRVSSILTRLILGEEKHEDLFDCLWNFAKFEIPNDAGQEFLSIVESLLVVRILYRLGYVARNQELDSDLVKSNFDRDKIVALMPQRVNINRLINNALRESHL